MMKIKGLLLLVALLAWVQGAFADDDVFEYEDDNNTVISGLVWGANPESLTIPASVTRVKTEAFKYATNLEELIIAGGNPVFESGVFGENVSLELLNLGSGMSTNNILKLIKTIGKKPYKLIQRKLLIGIRSIILMIGMKPRWAITFPPTSWSACQPNLSATRFSATHRYTAISHSNMTW